MAEGGSSSSSSGTEVSEEDTNPFQNKDELSDLVLVVEGKKLYVHRTCLSLYSPVFKCMLYSDFREKKAKEIELPEKEYKAFVEFLLHIYPVHSLRPVTDDNICTLLSLAEEYQVEHIRRKCRKFMNDRARKQPVSLSSKVTYLSLCDEYNFQTEKELLINELKQFSPHFLAEILRRYHIDEQLIAEVIRTAEIRMKKEEEERKKLEQEKLDREQYEREERFWKNCRYPAITGFPP